MYAIRSYYAGFLLEFFWHDTKANPTVSIVLGELERAARRTSGSTAFSLDQVINLPLTEPSATPRNEPSVNLCQNRNNFV